MLGSRKHGFFKQREQCRNAAAAAATGRANPQHPCILKSKTYVDGDKEGTFKKTYGLDAREGESGGESEADSAGCRA